MLDKWFQEYFIHIDLDDLRSIIPWYDWWHADCFRKAAIKIMEMLLDKAFNKWLNIILDGTFWSKLATSKNIARAKRREYNIKIYYINFDPELAWKFTLWREIEKERKVPFWSFYTKYFRSFRNIKMICKEYQDIEVTVLKKILTKGWHSSKLYKIQSYEELKKHEHVIRPRGNYLFTFIKLWVLTLKYRILIKKGLIDYDKYHEQNGKKNK